MNNKQQLRIMGLVIDLLRKEGMKIESPYDVENFFDNMSHSAMFETGRFPTEEDDAFKTAYHPNEN
jgi:hypothetical protein